MKKEKDFKQLFSVATSRFGRTVAVSGLLLCSSAFASGIYAAEIGGGEFS